MKIISASRREDIITFRSDYLVQNFKDYGENTFWVLWTKNPHNLIKLGLDYKRIALQLTITGLGGTKVEPNVPNYKDVIKDLNILIKEGLNPKLINWRFDPIILGYNTNSELVRTLAYEISKLGISRCIFSFITWYGKVRKNWPEGYTDQGMNIEKQKGIVLLLKQIFNTYGISLYSCAQKHFNDIVESSSCIDRNYYNKITGYDFETGKDISQRKLCGCTLSIDIGSYYMCEHKCLYCYAC